MYQVLVTSQPANRHWPWIVSTVLNFSGCNMRHWLPCAAIGLTAMLALAACHQEGPAERAGKSVDKAGQSVSDTLDPPQGPVQAAGRKVDRALGN